MLKKPMIEKRIKEIFTIKTTKSFNGNNPETIVLKYAKINNMTKIIIGIFALTTFQ